MLFRECLNKQQRSIKSLSLPFKSELIEMASIVQLTDDGKAIKDKFRELSKYFIWPIELGSGYYWEASSPF
jgi:hypothetical protein